jgi:hypothetical protein
MVYDATEKKKKVPKVIPRLAINDDYNHGMNGVDVSDQLAKAYEIGGPHWRNVKWTTAVSQDIIIKRSADAAYLIYERQCELDESARRALGGSPAAGSRSRSKPITPMSRVDFLESLAGGLIVTAYNVQKGINEGEKLKLTGEDAANPIRILKLTGEGTQAAAGRGSDLTAVYRFIAASGGAKLCLALAHNNAGVVERSRCGDVRARPLCRVRGEHGVRHPVVSPAFRRARRVNVRGAGDGAAVHPGRRHAGLDEEPAHSRGAARARVPCVARRRPAGRL